MIRKQFFPDSNLCCLIENEAKTKGVSESALIIDILKQYYGLSSDESPSITDLTTQVLDEIEVYVATLKKGDRFDLLSASPTYQKIDMAKFTDGNLKPSAIRASIGRSFAAKIGTRRFRRIRKAVTKDKNGKVKQLLSVNNALMYEVF